MCATQARFGAAQFDHMMPVGMGFEVVVKADNAIDLGPSQAQRIGQGGERIVGDMAKRLHHVMQDRQEWTLTCAVPRDDVVEMGLRERGLGHGGPMLAFYDVSGVDEMACSKVC